MGVDGHNGDFPGGLPSQDHRTYCGDDGTEGQREGMGFGIGGLGAGGNKDLENKGVCEQAAGKAL